MSSSVWKIEVDYGAGYGYVPVMWSPTFDTKDEAQEYINDDTHEWESHVRPYEIELEDD